MTSMDQPLVRQTAPLRWLPPLALGALLLLGFAAGLLWAMQGGEVFFAAIFAGIAACF